MMGHLTATLALVLGLAPLAGSQAVASPQDHRSPTERLNAHRYGNHRMIRRTLLAVIALVAVLAGVGVALYVGNAAPDVPPVAVSEAASPTRPFVVKLHAQWCPICLATKSVWSEIDETYAGRVNLVVFDFTNETTTARSRAAAAELDLEQFFDDYAGTTGTIVVLDARVRTVTADIHGSRDFEDYRAAIDAALQSVAR